MACINYGEGRQSEMMNISRKIHCCVWKKNIPKDVNINRGSEPGTGKRGRGGGESEGEGRRRDGESDSEEQKGERWREREVEKGH